MIIGRMEIPRVGISAVVLEGDAADILSKAVGHVPTTALPAAPGNVVIAGHRDTFFRNLRKIRKDDEITFTTTQGVYNYRVGLIETVGPRDVQVLQPSDHSTLTLITCYPFDFIGPAPQRFIVKADRTTHYDFRQNRLARAEAGLNPSSAVPHPNVASKSDYVHKLHDCAQKCLQFLYANLDEVSDELARLVLVRLG
jgi:LPXTG-site transpeptidase (sortase) family protein